MYILNLSGHDEKGTRGVKHFGGRFLSIDERKLTGG